MPQRSLALLEPRKAPVQARSTASVDAILQATIQVLLQAGKDRLTTTRVAARAGVSVGTLYQYFPNKNALLQAVLKRHLSSVAEAVESVCRAQEGETLRNMVTALVAAFLAAKMKDPKTSIALYAISSDVGGLKIARHIAVRCHEAIVRMLAASSDHLTTDPELVATMLEATMSGVSRRMLESDAPEKQADALCREFTVAACAYVKACCAGISR